jgi:hypothetical protein
LLLSSCQFCKHKLLFPTPTNNTPNNSNHEIEMLPKNSNQNNYESRAINYNARFPVPQKKAPPSKFSPVTSKVQASALRSGNATRRDSTTPLL